jgi:hypothetical protein
MNHSTKEVASPVTDETFAKIFRVVTAIPEPIRGAPDCPLVIKAGYTSEQTRKCDCTDELRAFAIDAPGGHPCGENNKCPARTFLQTH